jgi:hypothetical protein
MQYAKYEYIRDEHCEYHAWTTDVYDFGNEMVNVCAFPSMVTFIIPLHVKVPLFPSRGGGSFLRLIVRQRCCSLCIQCKGSCCLELILKKKLHLLPNLICGFGDVLCAFAVTDKTSQWSRFLQRVGLWIRRFVCGLNSVILAEWKGRWPNPLVPLVRWLSFTVGKGMRIDWKCDVS